ncbi:hypothetical protein CesoFtcFv8_012090 [Champsocephalus esox]|uniref:Uncharacterized protein n=1 Tax=Champsocephalus esox TaxID=159716 RepID=A0AAN8BUH7_9TELE|nr:hypothetical protein CesoFtcFv8_012090 [Champsocephalus esox]
MEEAPFLCSSASCHILFCHPPFLFPFFCHCIRDTQAATASPAPEQASSYTSTNQSSKPFTKQSQAFRAQQQQSTPESQPTAHRAATAAAAKATKPPGNLAQAKYPFCHPREDRGGPFPCLLASRGTTSREAPAESTAKPKPAAPTGTPKHQLVHSKEAASPSSHQAE